MRVELSPLVPDTGTHMNADLYISESYWTGDYACKIQCRKCDYARLMRRDELPKLMLSQMLAAQDFDDHVCKDNGGQKRMV